MAVALALGLAVGAEPPASLACLARAYGVVAVDRQGRWWGRLPDGRMLVYDDGRSKTIAQRLADPDLEDMFSVPYRTGPIAPVTEVDQDPGRIRVEALLEAVYGAGPLDLVTVRFAAQSLRVHRRIAPALARVWGRLQATAGEPAVAPFLRRLGGGFDRRGIAGTERHSAHAFGIAVDLNPALSSYWRWQRAGARWRHAMPAVIVEAFEAEGFIWGGRWYHQDTMHFEYRPELLDPTCAVSAAAGSPPE